MRLVASSACDASATDSGGFGVVALGEKDELLVHAGQRHLRMKPKDLESYIGERARRGRKLPRGFQKADRLTVE